MNWIKSKQNAQNQVNYGGVNDQHENVEKTIEDGSQVRSQVDEPEKESWGAKAKPPRSEETDLLPPSCGPRPAYLDVTRIAAVVCVAIDHGASEYGISNALFTQNWVLQILFLTAGISFCLSGKSLCQYLLRLGAYAAIGSACNLVAWIVAGEDWKHNMFNVVFQFWFVVGLMAYVTINTPVKHYLRGVRSRLSSDPSAQPQTSLPMCFCTLFGGLFLIRVLLVCGLATLAIGILTYVDESGKTNARLAVPNGLKHWLQVDTEADIPPLILGICRYLSVNVSSIYLAVVGPLVLNDSTMVSWIAVANTYVERLIWYDGSEERPFHALDLVTLGIVCYCLGMKHRKKVGDIMCRYWMVIILTCGVLWPPTLQRRLDEEPPKNHLLRFRYMSIEVILTVWWLVAGERFVDPEIFTKDKVGFLTDWALLVFLLHKALHVAVMNPWNWVILLALILPCWAKAWSEGKA